MKKIFMLCSAFCCLALSSAFATIGFNHPNVTSGGTVVWTVTGETPANHISAASLSSPHYVITSSSVSSDNPPPYGTGDGDFSDYFFFGTLNVTPYNCTTQSPTVISITCTSTGLVPVNLDIALHFLMKFDNCNGTNGTTTTDLAPGFTLFPVGQYGNSQRSQAFTKNNCGTGYTGSSVTYTVPQNTYSGSTQAAADAQAQTDINNNGQAYANAHGNCIVIPPTISFAVTNNSGNGLSITFVRSGQSNISVNAPAHSGTQHVTLPIGSGYYIGYNPSGMPVNCTVSLSNGESHPNAPGGNFPSETIGGTGGITYMTAN